MQVIGSKMFFSVGTTALQHIGTELGLSRRAGQPVEAPPKQEKTKSRCFTGPPCSWVTWALETLVKNGEMRDTH